LIRSAQHGKHVSRDRINPEVVNRKKKEYNVSLNVEQVPAETAASKLFWLDWQNKEWRNELRRILPPDPDGQYEVLPMYSNFNTPSWAKSQADYEMEHVLLLAEIEGKIQPLYTGGVMRHWFVRERWEPEELEELGTDPPFEEPR